MTKAVIAAHGTATLRELADLMLKHRIKQVPIVLGRKLLGVVNRGDLLKALISFGPTAYAPTVAAARSSDDNLRAAVLTALRSQGAVWLDAVVNAGTVHLWGVAPNHAVRQSYVDAAARLPGVVGVTDHMHVVRLAAHLG